MDFDDLPDEATYRTQVRTFLARQRELLAHSDGDYLVEPGRDDFEVMRESQQVLYDGGYVGVTWPTQYGGAGGTIMQQAIVNEELARAGVAGLPNHVGVGMCGPTVMAHGSEDQKSRYLRRLLRGDDIWCQLFSEPGSGSDLAALRTSARQVEDGSWVVNGQKVWTTFAQHAAYGILLARTDRTVAKHRGLTMFVVDMKAPGVTVRPIRQMNGVEEFNEVFFDNVSIPDSERLGDVNDGWRVALTTLMNERLAVGGAGGELGIRHEALLRHAESHLKDLPDTEQAAARQDLGEIVVESLASKFSGYRRLTALAQGRTPGPEASAGKLAATRIARATADLGVRLLGADAVAARSASGDWRWAMTQASVVGMSFAGGTDEILRNILGERVLGLPPEPRTEPTGTTSPTADGQAGTPSKAGTP